MLSELCSSEGNVLQETFLLEKKKKAQPTSQSKGCGKLRCFSKLSFSVLTQIRITCPWVMLSHFKSVHGITKNQIWVFAL